MRRTGTAGVVLIVVMLMTAVTQVEALRERVYPTAEDTDTSLYLTSPAALKRLSVSMNALAADVYWIRAIQYYGGTKTRIAQLARVAEPPPSLAWSSEYEHLYTLLDLTTSLDPRFKIAYRFGAVFLAEAYPNGAGRPDLAVALLEKGLRAEPDKWEYMEDIGFVHYWYSHDYAAASAAFDKAAALPGAPWWLRSLAATTLSEGGDRRSSRTLWTALRDSGEVDWLRGDAERRLAQLDALDQIDQLQAIVDRGGVFTRRPVDPAGVPYRLVNGRVTLAEASPLWPLPVEPKQLEKPGS